MKKTLLIGSLSLIAITAGLFISPLGKNILPESIVEKSMKEHTPEQRWKHVEKTVQQNLVQVLGTLTEGNPFSKIKGHNFPTKGTTDTKGTLTIHTLPEGLTGGQPTGFQSGTITVKALTEIDNSHWIHPRSKNNVSLDLDINLDETLTTQVGSQKIIASTEIDSIVDGENLYISLQKLESNSPLLPLDSPEIKSILDLVQKKWILFNDAMTNPFLPEGIDLNASNEAFMKALQTSLKKNIQTFSVWKQPIQGTKTGEWYEYNLVLDKEAFHQSIKETYTQAIYALSKSLYDEKDEEQMKQKEELENVYLSGIETFHLDSLESLTAQLSFHETDTNQFKVALTITTDTQEKFILTMNRLEDSFYIETPFASFQFQDEAYALTMNENNTQSISGTISDDEFTIEYKQEEQAVVVGLFTKEDDKWSGSITAEPFATLTLEEASLKEKNDLLYSILKASLSISDVKIASLDIAAQTTPQKSVSIQTPKEFTSFIDIITEIVGFNPYAPQEQPETMSDAEIQALLKSLEEEAVKPIQ